MALTTLLMRSASRLCVSAESERAARSILGADHPLARAVSLQRTLAIQLLVTGVAVVLGLAGILTRGQGALLVLGAAAFVGIALVVSALCARGLVRDRAQQLIAEGYETGALRVLEQERRRLASRRERERLARALEGHVRDAESWVEILPPFRPLPEVRCLRLVAHEARATAALLRADFADVRGVAATARFLVDGNQSPLFQGDVEMLRRELDRLRRLLSSGEPRWSVEAGRAA